jgi:hypothetical protein
MGLLLDVLRAKSPAIRKEKLKQLVGALGHEPGWSQKARAELIARGRRRVDKVAKLAAALPDRAGWESLAGRRIMEFGVGYVLSVPIVYWLAGASEVVATDYYAIVDLQASRRALHKADKKAIIQRLSHVANPQDVQARLASLLALERWTPDRLARLGLHYIAPLDASKPLPAIGAFDCIVSTSVLEHVPAALAGDILSNMQNALVPGGCQLHTIHLEDHRDLAHAPFAFLAADDDYQEGQSDARGNRLRGSEWMTVSRSVPAAEAQSLGSRVKDHSLLPDPLHPRYRDFAPDDLATATLTVRLRRPL